MACDPKCLPRSWTSCRGLRGAACWFQAPLVLQAGIAQSYRFWNRNIALHHSHLIPGTYTHTRTHTQTLLFSIHLCLQARTLPVRTKHPLSCSTCLRISSSFHQMLGSKYAKLAPYIACGRSHWMHEPRLWGATGIIDSQIQPVTLLKTSSLLPEDELSKEIAPHLLQRARWKCGRHCVLSWQGLEQLGNIWRPQCCTRRSAGRICEPFPAHPGAQTLSDNVEFERRRLWYQTEVPGKCWLQRQQALPPFS